MNFKILFSFVLLAPWCYCGLLDEISEMQKDFYDQVLPFVLERIGKLIFPTKLPIFVHDIDHPWVKDKKNIACLERRLDPIRDLCYPTVEGVENAGDCAIPLDLFDRLRIDNNCYEIINKKDGVNRYAWTNLNDRLEEMSKCQAALEQVTYLYIDTYMSTEYEPDTAVVELFAEVLSLMPNLERIRWGLPSSSGARFGEIFALKKLELPSVKYLVLGAEAHFMVNICPNITELGAGHYNHHYSWNSLSWNDTKPFKNLLKAASTAENLTSLSIQIDKYGGWSPQSVRGS